jgi:hypothetical protein
MSSNAISTITNTLTSSPLPLLIEKLGLSIANAQAALDANSIAVAAKMSTTNVNIDGKEYNLIALGFAPTFYAYTEASIEAKMDFSLTESESFEGSLSVGVTVQVVAVSISASYARKYEMSAEGSSSIAARMVSLPAPDKLKELLNEVASRIPVEKIEFTVVPVIAHVGLLPNIKQSTYVTINATVTPETATIKNLIWSVTPGSLAFTNPTNQSFTFEVPENTIPIVIKAKSEKNPDVIKEITLTPVP